MIAGSNSAHVVAWLLKLGAKPWRFQFYLNEIKELSSHLDVVFHHKVGSANCMANALAKQGVDRVYPWVACVM